MFVSVLFIWLLWRAWCAPNQFSREGGSRFLPVPPGRIHIFAEYLRCSIHDQIPYLLFKMGVWCVVCGEGGRTYYYLGLLLLFILYSWMQFQRLCRNPHRHLFHDYCSGPVHRHGSLLFLLHRACPGLHVRAGVLHALPGHPQVPLPKPYLGEHSWLCEDTQTARMLQLTTQIVTVSVTTK